MKFLITGACGFIGKHLCKRLLLEGHEVIGVDNFNSFIYDAKFKERNSEELRTFTTYTEKRGNLQDNTYILSTNPDIVIDLAAYANVRKSCTNPVEYVKNNVVNACQVITDVLKCESKPLLIYASSSSVYGTNEEIPFVESSSLNNIISIYALSKKMYEDMADLYSRIGGLKAVGLRFFTVYGPGGRPDMSIFNFLNKIKDGQEITLYGDGSMKRDFTFVEDIVEGIIGCTKLSLQKGENRIYNIGNNNPVNLNKLVEICEKVVQKKAILIYKPVPASEVPITYANIDKANRDLNYFPKTPLEIGIQKTYEWLISI